MKNEILAQDLVGVTSGTLVYGYTLDRNTFHVYLDEEQTFHRVIYDGYDICLSSDTQKVAPPVWFQPDKRAYPNLCNPIFSDMLERMGCPLPFTTPTEHIPDSAFVGKRREELHHFEEGLFKVGFPAVTWETLGLEDVWSWRFHDRAQEALVKAVQDAMSSAVDSYLRTAVTENQLRPRWLLNIPQSLDFYAKRIAEQEALEPIQLSTETCEKLVNMAIAATEKRLATISA